MKAFGGALGIFGGLLGLLVFLGYFIMGVGVGELPATGSTDMVRGVLGGLVSLACVLLGIAVLFGTDWRTGVLLLAAAVTGTVLGATWLMVPALIGGGVAIAHGQRRLRPEEIQQRLEMEIRQRYGGR